MLSTNVKELEKENEFLRKENKKLRDLLRDERSQPMSCEACEFFIQHYIKSRGIYKKTYSGHCTHGRTKERKPEGKTCQYFQLGMRKY